MKNPEQPQSDKFKDAAREHEADEDEDEARWKQLLRALLVRSGKPGKDS